MIKRILTLLLCLVLGMSILSGCKLLVLDEDKDMAEAVAVIESRSLPIKVLDENGNQKDSVYKTEEKVISKLELYNAYRQFGSAYQNQYGLTVEQAYETLLNQLVERELLLIEAEKLIASNQIRLKQSELNKIWKDIYSKVDDALYSYETDIAKEYDEEIYTRDQGVEITPDWPVFQYPNAPELDDDVEYPIENNIIMDEEVWTPEGSRGPIFDYAIIEFGTDAAKQEYFQSAEYRSAALKTEALRRFFQSIRDNLNPDILSSADAAKFEQDLKVIDQYKNAQPHEFGKLYNKLQDFWFIKYMYYDSAYSSMLFTKLQEYVNSDVAVSEDEVVNYYNKKLAEQKASFDADIANYISALKDGKELILYHPQDVKWFYVKHILVPFSDQQKADLENLKRQGSTENRYKIEREKKSKEIKSYEHINGFNVGEPKPISQIEGEIYEKMTKCEGVSYNAETTFEELIFKYNTDPGIFNNVKGYGMQYTDEKGTSGFMIEFEEASFKLYEKGVVGAIEKAVTDYGVHYIMLSSIVKPGTVELGEYTSVFADGLRDTKVSEALQKELLDKKKADAFNNYQNKILKQLNREWKPYITLYKDRYERLVKNAKG